MHAGLGQMIALRMPSRRIPVWERSTHAHFVVGSDGSGRTQTRQHPQIPRDVDLTAFCNALYQWASTITSSGQNLPFALPQKVDRTATGFKMAFLTQGSSGSFETIGAIEASVERIEDGTAVLMIRGSGKVVEKTLVDVPIVMGLMPNAIRQAVMSSRMPPSA